MAGVMNVTILGSGTGWLNLKRSACSVLVKAGDKHILLDIGPGTLRRLMESKVSMNKLDYILLSHYHSDHVSDLIPFLFSARYKFGFNRRKPTQVIGGKGLNKFYGGLKEAFGRWIEPRKRVTFKEASKRMNLGPKIVVKTLKVPHKVESIAFRIEYRGQSLVYSGDMDYSTEEFVKFAKDADLLIIECGLPDRFGGGRHLSPSIVGEVAKKSGAKTVVPIHFYPQVENEDIKGAIKKQYKGKVIVAKDLMKLSI